MKRLGLAIILALALAQPAWAFDAKGGGSGAGGAPSGTAGGDLGGTYPNPTVISSANLQQPVMVIGSSAAKTVSAAATTGAVNTPTGTANGDLEVAYLVLNNTTSNTFVGASGWVAIPNCNTSGNTQQAQAFVHTASSEPGTVTPITWTTNGTGYAWITSYRNTSGVDVCAANNTASGTTFSTSGITAAATSDRVVVAGGTTASLNALVQFTTPVTGQIVDFATETGGLNAMEVSYPIASTTVAAYGFTLQGANVSVSLQLGLTYAASTTAGQPGAITNGQYGAVLKSLTLDNGLCVGGQCYGLILNTNGTAVNGIGTKTSTGFIGNVISSSASNGGTPGGASNITIGDANAAAQSISIVRPVNMTTNALSTTSGTITSTTGAHTSSTGSMGPTGGGILQSFGGTLPTCACTGGSPTCTATTNSSNSAGQLGVTGGTGMTTCTLTFSASGAFTHAPICMFNDAVAHATPLGYATGAVSTATAVFDFVSAATLTVNYVCIGQ